MADILLSDLTNATNVTDGQSNGTGVYDKLMNTTNMYIGDQYNRGMLTGTDYATVLLGAMQGVMQASMQFLLQEKVAEAQIDLYNKQKDGFDHDAKQKLMKTVMDSWSILFSSAPDADLIPDAIKRQNVDKIVENAMIALGITETATMTDDTIDGSYPDTLIGAQA